MVGLKAFAGVARTAEPMCRSCRMRLPSSQTMCSTTCSCRSRQDHHWDLVLTHPVQVLGRALKDLPRDQIVVATKVGLAPLRMQGSFRQLTQLATARMRIRNEHQHERMAAVRASLLHPSTTAAHASLLQSQCTQTYARRLRTRTAGTAPQLTAEYTT